MKNFHSLIFFSVIAWPICGLCDEFLVQQLPAHRIEKSCKLNLYAIEEDKPSLGRADHSLILRWVCNNRPVLDIDKYNIDGGSPNVVTILYRHNRDIIVLVKWISNSQAADIQGEYYKVYAYRYIQKNQTKSFEKIKNIMEKLGEGWEGTINREAIHFPYKDATSIRKALDQFGY